MKQLLTLAFLIIGSFTFAQTIESFKIDFQAATNPAFGEDQLNKMFQFYSNLLTPQSDATQLFSDVKGESTTQFPLSEFKNEDLYVQTMPAFFNSPNQYHRILSYLVIAGTGDTSYEKGLLKKIETETNKGNLIWAGMALLHLRTEQTTALFDFIVKNETFGDGHMLPLFFKLNPDSLVSTAYQKINSENVTEKVLAAQLLSVGENNKKTEKLLLDAAANWEYNIKGYALYSIKVLKIGNLLSTLQPLLDSSQTRSISIEALANSPTKKDVKYLMELVDAQDTVSTELLDGFYASSSIENLRYWLQLLHTKPITPGYDFNIHKQPLLFSDELLADLQTALANTTDAKTRQKLVLGLNERTDEKSTQLIVKLLDDDDSGVRYWTASIIKGKAPKVVLDKVCELILQPSFREVSFTNILIDNQVDNLQSQYASILMGNPDQEWKRSSMEYLSTFPLEKHKPIFQSSLSNREEDIFIRRSAAIALGRLKDAESVELLIEVCKEESQGSDFNAQVFLAALGLIKGDTAKAYIGSFKDSPEETVRNLVERIFKEWE